MDTQGRGGDLSNEAWELRGGAGHPGCVPAATRRGGFLRVFRDRIFMGLCMPRSYALRDLAEASLPHLLRQHLPRGQLRNRGRFGSNAHPSSSSDSSAETHSKAHQVSPGQALRELGIFHGRSCLPERRQGSPCASSLPPTTATCFQRSPL